MSHRACVRVGLERVCHCHCRCRYLGVDGRDVPGWHEVCLEVALGHGSTLATQLAWSVGGRQGGGGWIRRGG